MCCRYVENISSTLLIFNHAVNRIQRDKWRNGAAEAHRADREKIAGRIVSRAGPIYVNRIAFSAGIRATSALDMGCLTKARLRSGDACPVSKGIVLEFVYVTLEKSLSITVILEMLLIIVDKSFLAV
jgi:hypothetical protein